MKRKKTVYENGKKPVVEIFDDEETKEKVIKNESKSKKTGGK